MDLENTENLQEDAVSEGVVDLQDSNEIESSITEESLETGEKNSEVADPKPKQTREENEKYAAARKEAERMAAAEKQRAEKLERDYSISKKYGAEWNVHSEEDIKEQYGIASLAEFEEAVLRKAYEEKGIDPDTINQVINNHPIVKEAKEQQRQQAVKQDIENLHKEFPGAFESIKEENDIYADPKWKEIAPYLQRGYELADAFYKVYKTDIVNKSAKSAVQSTIASIQERSKRGIISNSDAANDDLVVDLSQEGKKLANIFGNDPREIAKYVKSKFKK